MFTVELIDSYDKFLAMENIWNNLLEQSDMDIPFLTFEWLSCWWQSYGHGCDMLIFLIKDDKAKPAAILPLMRRKIKIMGLPVSAITFIANAHSLRTGMILSPGHNSVIELVFNYLNNSKYAHDLYLFDYVLKNSATDTIVTEMLKNSKLPYIILPGDISPYIPLKDSWGDFFKSKSKLFRKKLNNIINAFDRQKTHKIEKYLNGDQLKQGLEELLYVSKRTWKYRSKTAIASSKQDTQFYTSLAKKASQKGWLNLWILKIEGKPAAFAFNLERNGKIFALKMGFDEKFRGLSPGKYLDYRTIKESFSNKDTEFELLGKNEHFKMRWTSAVREHCKYMIFCGTMYGKTLYYLKKFSLLNKTTWQNEHAQTPGITEI